MKVKFTVPGKPTGKGRPRFNRKTGRTYTPKETAAYERVVRKAYLAAAPDVHLTGPIRAKISACYSIPMSWSNKKMEAALSEKILPTVKPDLDNVAKAVLDALNGIAYDDDSAVVQLIICKSYAYPPCVVVALEEMEAAR